MKKVILIISVSTFALIGIGVFLYLTNVKTDHLTEVKGFRYVERGQGPCLAMSPECGLCLGEVIDKRCFVDKSKLSREELDYMGFGN